MTGVVAGLNDPGKPWLADPDFTLWHGDVRDVLPRLLAESVDCALTSPPFYGLRDYGTGSWEGGDEGCDHAPARGIQGQSEASLRADRMFTGSKPQGQECSRCGARRVDRQIGLEATPDEWVQALVGAIRRRTSRLGLRRWSSGS